MDNNREIRPSGSSLFWVLSALLGVGMMRAVSAARRPTPRRAGWVVAVLALAAGAATLWWLGAF